MTLSARKKWPLWLLLICLLFVAPRAQALELFAQEGENDGGTVYELRTETGKPSRTGRAASMKATSISPATTNSIA